ncbi:MAG: flavodoxin family protein [Firmicutes bacterium]|nr:flavodoxin family protein [Bacillota bacterium]
MKTLVVYDSVFGNTERIALAIGGALATGGAGTTGRNWHVETLRVGDVKPEYLNGLELLIVGSPTRAFRPTKAITDFLNGIPSNGLKGVEVAAFDTRISTADVRSRFLKVMVSLFGYAAKPIADKLVQKGGALIAPPEGFFVKASEGPLKDGELERAVEWAKAVVAAVGTQGH